MKMKGFWFETPSSIAPPGRVHACLSLLSCAGAGWMNEKLRAS